MGTPVRIGIIICDRYRSCAGGKCFRALRESEGAFDPYIGRDVELVGFTSCGGCPGGNIEYAPEEMKKNGAEVIHLATCFVVGFPPCPSSIISDASSRRSTAAVAWDCRQRATASCSPSTSRMAFSIAATSSPVMKPQPY